MSCFGCLWSAVRVNKQRSVPWCPLVLLFRLAVLPFWQVTLTTPLVLQIPPWMDGKEWGRTAILLFSTSVMSSSWGQLNNTAQRFISSEIHIPFREYDIICLTDVAGSGRDRGELLGAELWVNICGGGNSGHWKKMQEYRGERSGGEWVKKKIGKYYLEKTEKWETKSEVSKDRRSW